MDKQDILKLDVTDIRALRREGYISSTYFCGNYSNQRLYSNLMNHMKLHGVDFPFNPACFKHDMSYHKKPTLREKITIDYVFFKDMMKIIDNYKGSYSKRRLKLRALVFYSLVVLMTPIYVFQGKVTANE